MKLRKSWLIIQLLLVMASAQICNEIYAQNYNPTYPRVVVGGPGQISYAQYSIGAKPYLWSQYDLISISAQIHEGGPEFAAVLRQYNPDAIILGKCIQGAYPSRDPYELHALRSSSTTTTHEVNPGDTEVMVASAAEFPDPPGWIFIDREPVRYRVKTDTSFTYLEDPAQSTHPVGTTITAPIRFVGLGYLPDLSEFAVPIDGKPGWQYLVDLRFERSDFTNFDGTAWDAFREFFYDEDFDDVDLDRNGVNDKDEHGLNWINDQWMNGITNLLNYERQRFEELHPDKPSIILVNCGGGGGERGLFGLANGAVFEGFLRFAEWENPWGLFANMQGWLHNGQKPSVFYIKDYVKEVDADDGKNDFTYMRWGLTTALLGDGFYGRTFGDWYYIAYWYDEFNSDLGYPTTEAYKLSNGTYVRFFDKGAVICNPTGITVTVNDADISGLAGYAGPYYRLIGGQDPDFNSGEIFQNVELYGWTGDKPKRNRGDGILLFNEYTVCVGDIIIGNYNNNDTSPGSSPAQYEGSWSAQNSDWISFDNNNPYYTIWTAKAGETVEGYGYFVASPGSGEATATYTPAIGVAGYYEVFEWHGWHGTDPNSYQEASNVPWELVVGTEKEWEGQIDQTTNYGQWNRLGIFYFPKGNNSYVKITNNANGYVISDAFCFRYRGANKDDNEPPSPPQGVRIKKY